VIEMNIELRIFLVICSLSFAIWKISKFIKAYKNTPQHLSTHTRIEMMVYDQMKNPFLAATVRRDLLIYYYLFSKKRLIDTADTYTLHKKTGYGGLVFGFMFVMVLEGIGVSFFLHNWNPLIAWIHLVFSVYMIIFLISDYKAIKQNPVYLSQTKVHIRLGFREDLEIDLNNIELINNGKLHFEEDKKNKDVLNATLLGFEEPDFEIVLKDGVPVIDGLGRRRSIKKIYISLDEKDEFMSQFTERKKVS
jgi:hypothetical protein